jgi:hypothetical protein
MSWDRKAHDDVRQRRLSQRGSAGQVIDVGGGLAYDSSGNIVIEVATDAPFDTTSGLALVIGAGLDSTGGTLVVDLASSGGLEFSSGDIRVVQGNGITVGAGGVSVNAGDGLDASGASVVVGLLTNGGLEFTGGELNIADTIDLGTVGASNVLDFSTTSTAGGINSGDAFVGNDASTASTAVLKNVGNATNAVAQTSAGVTTVGSSGRLDLSGTSGSLIGSSAGNTITTVAASTVIGGGSSGTLTASGTGSIVIGAAVLGTISSTQFGAFSGGFTQAGTITGTGFGSFVWGFSVIRAMTCSGSASVAFGLAAAAVVNQDMTVAGDASIAVGAGHNTLAAADCSAAFGRSTEARHFGSVVNASGRFATGTGAGDGDQQTIRCNLALRTTDATATQSLLINGSGRFTLIDNSVMTFNILVAAKEETTSSPERAGYRIEGVISRDAGVGTTNLRASTVTVLHESNAALACVVAADTTNGALDIQVTGLAATNIRWVATVTAVEVEAS